jgi:hypothetical protein
MWHQSKHRREATRSKLDEPSGQTRVFVGFFRNSVFPFNFQIWLLMTLLRALCDYRVSDYGKTPVSTTLSAFAPDMQEFV